MSFAAPLFLLAALAAAIPIVLHMISRKAARELPFPTLRFLKLSVEKTRRRKRIQDALLMMIRAAALLLIAAGLARPAVTNLSSMWGGAQAAAVIVLDNSTSMGIVDRENVRFDMAVAAAGQILDQFGERDEVALLPTCGPPLSEDIKLERNQDNARRILAQVRVSYQRADLAKKLQQARQLLADSEAPNKHIFVICDMQKVSWEGLEKREGTADKGEGEAASEKSKILTPESPALTPESPAPSPESPIPIIIVDCNRSPKPNVAVQGVAVEATAPIAGLPVKTAISLFNASSVQRQPRVELLIDGVKQASSPEIIIPPDEKVNHELQFSFATGGLHRGEVRLVGEDGSRFDDRRFFAMQVEESIPVAIVRGRRHEIPYLDDGFYLERALAPEQNDAWAVRTASLVAADLMAEPLEKYRVIFCVNLPALSAEAAERLAAYVAAGGNLVWICGDNVDPGAYNTMNEQAGGRLLPAPLLDLRTPAVQDNRDSWHISFLDPKYRALRLLLEPPSLYESVLVYKHIRMAAADGDCRVLARLDDGEPLLALRSVGRGRVLLFGATMHVNWSNLPLRPIFLPLMARLTFDMAEVEQRFYNLLAGQPIVLPLADRSEPVGVELVPPSGEALRLRTEPLEHGAVGQQFRYANTYEIGVYVVRLMETGRATQLAYSVNFDPDETDPTTIQREELQKLLAPAPLVFAANPDDLSDTFAWLREGQSLWGFFLTAVLVVLVCETFISNCFSPSRAAEGRPAHSPVQGGKP